MSKALRILFIVLLPILASAQDVLVGITSNGGLNGLGTIFSIKSDGTNFHVLRSFARASDGGNPTGSLIQGQDGLLYGLTSLGGKNDAGTIFKIAADGTGFSIVRHLTQSSDGAYPKGSMIQGKDGAFYGMTSLGGSSDYGTIFRINADGTGFRTLLSFSSSNGLAPQGDLLQASNGILYGMTSQGGTTNQGTLFKLNGDGSGYTVLKSFSSADGIEPYGNLLEGSDGSLYGMTFQGGTGNKGTLFKINGDSSTFLILKNFASPDGTNPVNTPVQGSDGAIYGLTSGGGTTFGGTFFKTNGTSFTTLRSFSNSDGRTPNGSLLKGSDGFYYGTATFGGNNDGGTLFKMKADGTSFSVLRHLASSDGINPTGSLVVVKLSISQSINFASLSTKTYGDAPFTLSATASSGLPVSFHVVSGPATLSGNTLTLTGAGQVTVKASQAGNTTYSAAPDVMQAFMVNAAANTAPTISSLADQTLCQNTASSVFPFTVGDKESATTALLLTAASSNTTLVANANIILSGSAANRTVKIAPTTGQSGTTTITLTVTDENNTKATSNFTIVVTTLPTINAVANQAVIAGNLIEDINFSGTAGRYTWTTNNPSIGLAASGLGNIPSFTPSNATGSPITATVTVTPASLNNGFAYVANSGSNTVSVINTITNKVVARIPVGDYPMGVSTSPDASRIYIANMGSNNVSVINTATNSVSATIAVEQGPYGISVSPDGSRAYVANAFSSTMSVINTNTNAVVATIPIGNYPSGILVSSDGSRVYVANGESDNVSVINTSNNTVVATIPVGNNPYSLTMSPNGNSVYASNFYDNSISIINTVTNTVTAIVPLDSAPRGIAVSPDGSQVYVAIRGSISLINTNTNAVTTKIPLNGADGISISPDGSQLYAVIWGSNAVSVISTLNNTVITTVPVESDPVSLGNFVIGDRGCSGPSTTFTITVNPANTAPTITGVANQTLCQNTTTSALPFTVGDAETTATALAVTATSSNTALVPNANIVVAGSGANRTVQVTPTANQSGKATITLTITDGGGVKSNITFIVLVNALPTINAVANQTVVAGAATTASNFTGNATKYTWTNTTPSVGLASSGTGSIPSFTAINSSSNPIVATITATPLSEAVGVVYVSNYGSNTVSVINTITNQVVNTISVGIEPAGVKVSPDGSRLYVVNSGSNTVSVINTTTNQLMATVPTGLFPEEVSITPDGSQAYVVNYESNTVTVINTNTYTVTATISVGDHPEGVLVNPDGKRVYVANTGSAAISVINTSTNQIVATIPTGKEPDGMAISPDGSRLYVTLYTSVLVINTSNNKLVATIPVGISSLGIAINPNGSVAYVANRNSNTISVINTATNTVATTIPVGANPFDVSVSQDGSQLYVTNYGSGNVSVINISTNLVVDTIPVGEYPLFLSNFITNRTGCSGASATFTITVNPTNTSPTITGVANQTLCQNTTTSALPFTIGDAETTATALAVTATSSNTALVPNANIVLGGSGANRTVQVTPSTGQSGTATIMLTVTDGSGVKASTSFTFTVNALPTTYVITGGGTYCEGSNGVTIGLANSQTGVSYQLMKADSKIGAAIAGTGQAISFGNQAAAGTYIVLSVNSATTCSQQMSGSATVTTNTLPTAYALTSTGSKCAGSNTSIELSGSESGVNYQLQVGSTNVGTPISGNGSTITFPNQNTPGTYTVVARRGTCPRSMNGSIVINALPSVYSVTGGGSYCEGSSGVAISLFNSQASVSYQLKRDGLNIGSAKVGTGSALSFGNQTMAGSYTISAVSASACTQVMSGSATVSINTTPTVNAGNSQTTCANDNPITLSGFSPTGGTWSGKGVSATGIFTPTTSLVGNQTLTYTITSNGCTATATKTITVKAVPSAPTASADISTVGGTLHLSANTVANATYQWNGPDGFSSTLQNPSIANVTAAQAGTYSIKVSTGGCTSTAASVQVFIKPASTRPVTLSIDSVSGTATAEIVVPVRVKDFKNILSLQGSITWNSAIASFMGVETFGLPGMGASNFGTTQTTTGKLSFSWNDPNLKSQNLADNAVLFALRFKLVGKAGTVSALNLGNTPVPIEVADGNGAVLTANLKAGAVTILSTLTISGKVTTPSGEPIKTVSLQVMNTPQTSLSTANGSYQLDVMGSQAYTLKAQKNNDASPTNGITTLDLVLLQRHILQVVPLNSAYKIIAADVNGSGTVTTLDLVLIRSLILRDRTTFPGNKLWSFVNSDFRFPDATRPFPFDSTRTISQSASGQDFIGVKLGDLNDTWDASARTTTGQIGFALTDQHVQTGADVEIPVKVSDFQQVGSYQFTFNWDPTILQYQGVTNQALAGNFGLSQVPTGQLATSWNDPRGESQSLTADQTVFTVKFKVIGKIGSQSAIRINSSMTQSIGYSATLSPLLISSVERVIKVTEQAIQPISDYALQQNQPNPFDTKTIIPFVIPQATRVHFTIYNQLGQVVKVMEGDFMVGENQLEWDGTMENGQKASVGTYYYQMQAGTFRQTKKLLIIR